MGLIINIVYFFQIYMYFNNYYRKIFLKLLNQLILIQHLLNKEKLLEIIMKIINLILIDILLILQMEEKILYLFNQWNINHHILLQEENYIVNKNIIVKKIVYKYYLETNEIPEELLEENSDILTKEDNYTLSTLPKVLQYIFSMNI